MTERNAAKYNMKLQQSELHLLQSHSLGTLTGQVLVGALQLLTQLYYLIS